LAKEFLPDIGIAAVTGKILKEVTRQTVGMHPIPRMGILGGTAFAVAGGTAVGMGKSAVRNIESIKNIGSSAKASTESSTEVSKSIEISKSIEVSKSTELSKSTEVSGKADTVIDTDGRSSPSDFDGLIIPSLLDENEIPLIVMVNGLSYLNYLEFSLIFSLFSLIFRKYLIKILKRFILNKNIIKIKKRKILRTLVKN